MTMFWGRNCSSTLRFLINCISCKCLMRVHGGTFVEIRLSHDASLLQDEDLGKCVISVYVRLKILCRGVRINNPCPHI